MALVYAVTANGLSLPAKADLVDFFTTQYETIYGSDINLDSDTPDGQMMNIVIQQILDLQDLLTQIYNMFDPDQAIGNVLDQRVSINGIQRQGGTYTVTNVTLVTTQSVNLYGLDQEDQDVFTVADQAGNQWQLITTVLGVTPGTNVYAFQAANPGAVLTVPNTITVPVSIIIGVSTINNPTTYTTLGEAEESDALLKVRRQKSVSLASQGFYAGLLAALSNVTGVTSAFVYENDTNAYSTDGIPPHSIWVIVAGTGASASIAQAIYTKRNAGCGMFGAQSYNITQVDGSTFTVYWDVVSTENVFLKFTVTPLNPSQPVNIAAVKTALAAYAPAVNQELDINLIAAIARSADSNALVTFPSGTQGISTAATGPFTYTLSPSSKAKQFVISQSNTIVLPMQLVPATAVIAHGTTQTFTGLGGFGTLIYTLTVNNSGGYINSSTGLYTAGATAGVNDTVQVTDAQGNTATAVVTVS